MANELTNAINQQNEQKRQANAQQRSAAMANRISAINAAATQAANDPSKIQSYTISTTSGKKYTVDRNQMDWIKSRYKQDWAGTYGVDDADQYAYKNGQMSAKWRKTYGNSNVDRQLAELGLPSEKNLEKYIADYQNWHTGGISDYFGKDTPQDFYTKTKEMFKGDWQYDDTQEDQLRKSSGQMPSKLAAKYTDTEIDDELRVAGLPPVAEMGKYIGRYNNYSAIDNLYKNAAVAWANLGMTQDKNGQYIQNDNKVYTMEDGRQRKGKDLYAEAFYDEMRRKDKKGDYVYGNIFGMFKNNHLEDYDPDDYDGTNYNQYLGKEFVNASKVADLADDYAAYTAFSYDDFAGKYGDYYDKYLKSYKFSDGQTLEEKMKGIALKNDEQAKQDFYDVSDKWFDDGRGTSDFVARYKQMYPNNTYEQMFTDMFENGVPESTIRKTMTTLRNDTSVTGGKNWADDKMSGFKDLTNAYANARQKYLDKQAAPADAIPTDASALTAFDAMQSIEQYMTQNGGWTADNATKAVEALQKAGASYDTIKGAVEEMQDLYGVEHNDVLTALVNASALTYNPNKAELEKIGNEFNALVNGNVDYNKRPIVLPEAMWQAGYTDFDRDDVATTYFTTLGVGEGDNLYTVLATPILNDGTVLSKQELEDYVASLDTSNGIKGLLDSDKYGIVVNTRQGDYDPEYWEPLIDKLGEIKEQHTDLALPLEFSERTLPQFQKQLRASMEENMKLDGEDKATIETAYEAIDNMLTSLITTDEGVASVNDVIAVLNSIENANWNNPVAMEKALEEYGFTGFGQFTGLADKLTKNWSNEDKLKLSYAIGSTRVADADPEYSDFTDKLSNIFGFGDWIKSGEAPITKRSMMYNDFSYALDWAEEQIANRTLTKAQAYQVLSAEGFSPELEQYVGRDWHEAIYKELMVPQLVQQAGGAQLATWEEMTPEEQQKMADSMYDSLTDEQYAQLFGDADWWKANPNVYRTFGQAFEQQFAALLPSLATDLITSTVELGDMIGAAFTGRPELDDGTQKWLKAQEFVQNYGSVNDDVNGTKVADVMSNVAGEILRMQTLGIVGAGAGAAFEATGVGGKVAQLAAGNPGIVKKVTGMALSLVRSSPFVANAWAHDYAELKSLGASNSEAMWNSMITGMAEGILEGFNFDNLWGKVLGQEAFATEILDAGKRAFGTAGIVWKARIANMAASGLGEFTEESIGYVLDTYLKMRHSDTWGRGTEWSAKDWLAQAGMGFLVGAIGGGMSSMDINASRILSEYAMSSEEGLRAVFPDVFVSDGVWDTANETVKASYRTGGATVLSDAAYKTLREQAEACVASAQKTLEAARADEADAQEKINNAESEVRKLEDKLAPYMLVKGRKDSLTGEEAEEFGALYAKWNEAKRHAESVRNEVAKDLAEKAGNHERSLQNAESQLKDLQKKIQEHFCGIYLMNEGATPEQAFENMMNAYQNGFKVEGKAAQAVLLDEQTQETQAGTASQEEAAGNNSTTENGNEEPAPVSGSSARVAARELAYNRVYKDADAGKAYANAEDTESESGEPITPLSFVGKELNDFKAKTTAKIGNVTVEFSEFSPTEKMTSKEIIEAAKQSMTEEAAKKLDALISLGKALGVPMVIRDVVAGLSGYAYDGKIYVTLNGSHSVLRTVSHELTHWMRNTSNYSALRNHLVNDVGGKEAFDKMVDEKAKEYGIDMQTDDGRSRADDEVCAELCEKMLENKESLEKFVSKDLSAAKSLRSRLGKTLKAVRSVISSLGSADYETRGDLIKQQETIETWYNNLSEAIDEVTSAKKTKPRAAESVRNTEKENAHENGGYYPYDGVPEYNEPVFTESAEQYESPPLDLNGMPPEDYYGAVFNPLLDRSVTADGLNGYVPKANPLTGVTVEDDAEYMRAAIAGDHATTSRMTAELMLRNGGKPVLHGTDARVGSWTKIDWDRFASHQMFVSPEEAVAGSYVGNNGRFVRPLRYADEGKVLENYVGLVNKWMGTDYSVAQTEDGKWTLTDSSTGNVLETDGSVDDVAEVLTNSVENLENFFGDEGLPDGINNPFSGGIMSLYYFPQNEANHRGFRQYYSNVLSDSTIPSSYIIYDEIRLTTNADGTQELYAKTSDGKTMTAEVDNGDVEGAFKNMFGGDSNVYDFFNDANDIEQHEDGSIILVSKEIPVSPKKHRVFKFENYQNAGYSTDEIGRMDADAGYDSSVITNIVDGGTKVLENGGTLSFPADIAILRNENRIKSGDDIVFDDDGNIIPLSERIDFGQNELRHSVDSELSSLINQYGAQPQGHEPRASDVRVPNRTNPNNRVSRLGRSVMESQHMTDDMRERGARMMASEDWLSYIPKTNEESMEEARNYIAQRQPLQAQQEFHDMVMQGKFGRKTNAIGLQLLADASNRGDVDSFFSIATDLQIAATEAGQSAQIFNVLKELKGVGSAYYMQRVIDRMNAKYDDLIQKGKMERITVPQELMDNLSKATTVDEIANAEEAVAKVIANQLPLTWTDRLSNWRYFSMLGNPTTHVRNMFGNLLMKGLNTAKDAVATGIETVGGVSADQRGHAILTSADKAKWQSFADESYKEQARNLSGGGKLGFETFVEQNKRSFDAKWLNALAKLNFKLLEGEDIMFIRPAYKNALMQYMKAQGYMLNDKGVAGKFDKKGKFVEMSNAQKTAAVEWASQQAWKQTFRDASSLATLLNKLSKENAVSKLLVEGVMPFKKTPINIAKRGLEYSPAGIIMGTTQLLTKVKQGKMTAAQAIDNLASGITGTALMALGVALAKMGLIRAGGEDKKKYETYLQDTGDQTYAMKFGDYSVNMSAIAPATIPLFMGVALNEMIEQSGENVDLSTITDTIAGTLNPFMEMSFMASLNSALKNYNSNGIGGALGGTLLTAAQNYGSQYLPTLGGKIAQFADPTLRSTKSSATSPIGGNMDYYARSLAKKIPGLEATLEPDVNVWGQTTKKDTFGEWLLDVANKFVLPTNVKVANRDAVDNELIRVVESTGNVDFLPSDGNKYFTVKGKKYSMNARQYAQYSQERGQAAYAALKDVMSSPAYVNASDEAKADMLNKAKEAAYKAVNNIWKDKLGAFNN